MLPKIPEFLGVISHIKVRECVLSSIMISHHALFSRKVVKFSFVDVKRMKGKLQYGQIGERDVA